MSARPGDLIGNDAEQLPAEGEQHLAALAVSMFAGNEHDTASQACESL